jgi:hypothetical protein
MPADKAVHDAFRVNYYRDYLDNLCRSKQDGARITAYYGRCSQGAGTAARGAGHRCTGSCVGAGAPPAWQGRLGERGPAPCGRTDGWHRQLVAESASDGDSPPWPPLLSFQPPLSTAALPRSLEFHGQL